MRRWIILIGIIALANVGSPARASFESALFDYESGAHVIAYQKLQILEEQGDKRAQRFLERMRMGWPAVTTGWLEISKFSTSTVSEHPIRDSEASGPSEGQSSSVSQQIWEPFEKAIGLPEQEAGIPRQAVGFLTALDIATPSRHSIVSKSFFLPADSTMVGLQYIAQAVDAYEVYREFRIKSQNGNDFVFWILAAFWWFLILRVLYVVGNSIFGSMSGKGETLEIRRYG